MNIAIILAGGTGTRVGGNIPKQFIKVLDKPILVYTLEIFNENENIDEIEIVCHKDYMDYVKELCSEYKIDKFKYLCNGGNSFQESTINGVLNLKDKVSRDDIVVISFGVSPMTPKEDIDDSIRVCEKYGNGICSVDMDLCTCIKDDEISTTQNILRETIKGFANPWTFRYGELLDSYECAIENDMIKDLEPHTTSLYLALGKRLYFSKCTTSQSKITHRSDIDLFEGYLLLKEKRNK